MDQPEDYLMILPVWIRLRKIPVNHYTVDTITEIAETVGQVIELAFDPQKPQRQDFVRVRVLFNVAKSLKNSKAVQLPNGSIVSVGIDSERVRKRCYQCQRLTHDKQRCPWNPINRQETATEGVSTKKGDDYQKAVIHSKADPLFGVLSEDQVGFDVVTGRQRISTEVLDEMRQYLQVQNITERKAREERIKKSIRDLEGDTMGQKSLLRLEPKLIMTKDYNKGKGIVFNFEDKGRIEENQEKLMEGAMRATSRPSKTLILEDMNASHNFKRNINGEKRSF